MENRAGCPVEDNDKVLTDELKIAGIEVLVNNTVVGGEVKTHITGALNGWTFERLWYYWSAKGNPGLILDKANTLHENHGKVVRVQGHCGCPPPKEWASQNTDDGKFYVDTYHIDSQIGLQALANAIKE